MPIDRASVESLRDLIADACLSPTTTLRVIAEDPTDDRILEYAVASGAGLIVSGDRHLRKLKSFRNIGIVQPSDFFRTLG